MLYLTIGADVIGALSIAGLAAYQMGRRANRTARGANQSPAVTATPEALGGNGTERRDIG